MLTEAVVWGLPIVSMDAMRQAFFRDAGARYGDIVYLSRPADWQFQLATPNASTYYVYFNFRVTSEPWVLEVPAAVGAGLFGSLLDAWQVPLVDVGPAGEDAGRGGKYLLLPPGYQGETPAGFIPVQLETYSGYSMLRAIPDGSSPAAVQRAIELVQQLRLYALSQASAPPVPRFIDMSGRLFDGIVRFDASYFERLSELLDSEPPLPRDAAMLARLKALGFARGEPVLAGEEVRSLWLEAARRAQWELRRAAARLGSLYWPDRHWRVATGGVGPDTGFVAHAGGAPDLEARGLFFFLACAPPKIVGKATFYLSTFVDAVGKSLSGETAYRLRIPANVPASQFWAATVYASDTAAFIQHAPRLEVSSYDPAIAKNADGSVDLYFGPKPPAGREHNWIATRPGTDWFVAFRTYGPQKPLFEHAWRLPDIVPAALSQAKPTGASFAPPSL